MEEDLGGEFLVAIEELGQTGLWASVKEIFESRLPLQRVALENKLGNPVLVDRLPAQYVLSADKRVMRLKPFAHSASVWFRIPFAHVILVSTTDVNEYKSIKALVRRVVVELERDWGQAEWTVVYVRPPHVDALDSGAKRVHQLLLADFAATRKDRVVRLDPLSGSGHPAAAAAAAAAAASLARTSANGYSMGSLNGVLASAAGSGSGAGSAAGLLPAAAGLEDLDTSLRECVKASFRARQMAYNEEDLDPSRREYVKARASARNRCYNEEVRRLLNQRLDPDWSFPTFYLVKDSLALLLEGAGLIEDAHNELMELETVYLEALRRGAVRGAPDLGTASDGGDAPLAALMPSWRSARRLVMSKTGVPEFQLRQYLFAAQARLLLRLGRPLDALKRGLAFVDAMCHLLGSSTPSSNSNTSTATQNGDTSGSGDGDAGSSDSVPRGLQHAWAFSTCVALAGAVHATVGRGAGALLSPSREPDAHAAQHQQQQHASASGTGSSGASGSGGRGDVAFGSDWDLGPLLPRSMCAAELVSQLDPEALSSGALAPVTAAAAVASPRGLPGSWGTSGDAGGGGLESARDGAARTYHMLLAHLMMTAWRAAVELAAIAGEGAGPSTTAVK
ncbi:hypothetical protein FOA52_001967 [Chlamydomonas sp. UWO 241]|nr:hypothetical protein FOA52_001967 [Chlamydomonas sp. UWO 241]